MRPGRHGGIASSGSGTVRGEAGDRARRGRPLRRVRATDHHEPAHRKTVPSVFSASRRRVTADCEEGCMNGPRLYLGIDPGISGGLAAIDERGQPVMVRAMPDTESDVYGFLREVGTASLQEDGCINVVAMLERVGASPQMGVVSAFTFGKGIGGLRMALLAAEIPFDEVTPGTWQKGIGIRQQTGKTTLGATHKKDKNIAKRRAQELFPGVKVTHALADALLIAEVLRRSRVHVKAEV
jgi:hypothetical protein